MTSKAKERVGTMCVNSHWYYRKWWHKYLKIKHVSHDCFPMEWRDTPIRKFNRWVAPPANKGEKRNDT